MKCKISFINELADLMDKFDVHLILDAPEHDAPSLFMIQNDWEPIDIPYDWHDGKITASTIREL